MLKKGSPNPLAGMAGQLWNRLFVHLPIHTEERRGRGGAERKPGGELLAKFSVWKERVTWAPPAPTHFSLVSQRNRR